MLVEMAAVGNMRPARNFQDNQVLQSWARSSAEAAYVAIGGKGQMRSETDAWGQLPKSVAGTPEELAGIALSVIRGDPRARGRPDQARLQRVSERLQYIASTVLTDLQQQASGPPAKEVELTLERIARLAEELTEIGRAHV